MGETRHDIGKLEILLKQAGVTKTDRSVVGAALVREEVTGGLPAMAIELPDGTIVTGKTGELLGGASAALLNAIKVLSGIPHEEKLVSPEAIEPIQRLKTKYLGGHNPRLHTDEILIALSATAAENAHAESALEALPLLKGCEAHSTVLLSSVDEKLFARLGMHLTCEPRYEEETRKYHGN